MCNAAFLTVSEKVGFDVEKNDFQNNTENKLWTQIYVKSLFIQFLDVYLKQFTLYCLNFDFLICKMRV